MWFVTWMTCLPLHQGFRCGTCLYSLLVCSSFIILLYSYNLYYYVFNSCICMYNTVPLYFITSTGVFSCILCELRGLVGYYDTHVCRRLFMCLRHICAGKFMLPYSMCCGRFPGPPLGQIVFEDRSSLLRALKLRYSPYTHFQHGSVRNVHANRCKKHFAPF